MVELNILIGWCDSTLNAIAFQDYCPNGLQIEGRCEVKRLATAVTASQDVIARAVAVQADALLVHHGYFWKGEPMPLTGLKGQRVKQLMQANLSLIAYHLPLDAHPLYGNNAALADLFGLKALTALDPTEKQPIGLIGTLDQATSAQSFAATIEQRLGRSPLVINPRESIAKIGFCTGGAQDFLYKAASAGCDAYISGEVSERTFHEAHEYGLTYFACGHHATERYGVQRLGDALAAHFELEHIYLEIDNPV